MGERRSIDFPTTPLPKKDLFLEKKIFFREGHVDIVSLARQYPEAESKIIDFFVNKLIDNNRDYFWHFWQRYDLADKDEEYVSLLERGRKPLSGLDKPKLWLLNSFLLGNRKAQENLNQLLDLGIPVWDIFELFRTNRRLFKELLSDDSFRTGLIYLEQLGVRFYYGASNPELVRAIVKLGKVDQGRVEGMAKSLESSFTLKNVIFAGSVDVYGGYNSGSYSFSAGRLNSIIKLFEVDYFTDDLVEAFKLQDRIIALSGLSRDSILIKNSAGSIVVSRNGLSVSCADLPSCLKRLPNVDELLTIVELVETYFFHANDSKLVNKLFNGRVNVAEVFNSDLSSRVKNLKVKKLLLALDRMTTFLHKKDDVDTNQQEKKVGEVAEREIGTEETTVETHQDISQVLLANLKTIAQRGWPINTFATSLGSIYPTPTETQFVEVIDKVKRLAKIAQDEELSNWVSKIFSLYRKDLADSWNIDVVESLVEHRGLIDSFFQIYDYLFRILSNHVTAVDDLDKILNSMEAKVTTFFRTEYGFSRGGVFSLLTSLLKEIDLIDKNQLQGMFTRGKNGSLLPILKEFSKKSFILGSNSDALEEDFHTLAFISNNLQQHSNLLDEDGNPTLDLIKLLASPTADGIIKSDKNIVLTMFNDVIRLKFYGLEHSAQMIELMQALDYSLDEEGNKAILNFILSNSKLLVDLFKIFERNSGTISLIEFVKALKDNVDISVSGLALYPELGRLLLTFISFDNQDNSITTEEELKFSEVWRKFNYQTRKYLVNSIFLESGISSKQFVEKVLLIGKIDSFDLPELLKIKDQLIPLLLESAQPHQLLDEVVEIFRKNNLPLFAKKLKIFEILYFGEGMNGKSKFDSILDRRRGYLSPVFELGSKRRVLYTAYRDLLRISVESNDFNLRAYLLSIQENEDLLIKLDNVGLHELSESEQAKLELFMNRLLVLYNNSLIGKSKKETPLATMSLEKKLVFLRSGLGLKPNQRIIDRLSEMFLKPLGFSSIDEVISRMDQAQQDADERNRLTPNVNEGKFQLSEGDLLKAVKVDALFLILRIGITAKDFLGVGASSDSTPFDADFSKVISDDVGRTTRSIIETSPSGGGEYGNVILVVRDRDQFNISRKQKHADVEGVLKYDRDKYELFISDVIKPGSGRHWGVRVGIPSTQVDALVVRHESMSIEDIDKVIDAVLASGFYIPVFDHDGNIIFSPEDYDRAKTTKQPIPVLDFEKIGDKQGSNEGGTYLINKERFYVKHGLKDEDDYSEAVARVWNEWLATKFYETFGLNVPESSVISLVGESEISYATRYLNGKRETGKAVYQHESFLSGWIMDCYLANWDVLLNDNVEMYDGFSYRLDNGGALLFRARGRRKGMDQTQSFGPEVLELDSMSKPDGVTEEEIIVQAEKLVKTFTNETIDSLVDLSGLSYRDKVYLRRVLKLRRNYIARRYNIENPYAYGANANETDLVMKFIDLLDKPNISGKNLLTHLYDLYPELYNFIVWNNESLEKHTLRVLRLFEKYNLDDQLPESIDVNKFKLILAVHDIGKPKALSEGNRKQQHKYNPVYIERLFKKLNMDKFYTELAVTLSSTDIIDWYIRGNMSLDDAVTKIKDLSNGLGMEASEFFNLLCIYYKVDTGSYSQLAGLNQRAFGDELVMLDDEGRQLLFSSLVQSKISLIEQELNK